MSLAANVALCNAEVLGTGKAERSTCESACVAGGVISGILDMGSGAACFAASEAILQDLGIAEVHEHLYGFDFAIGTGYTDAKYPGIQSVMEKMAKYWAAYQSGRVNYPLGLVSGGKAFSPEQALLDLETAALGAWLWQRHPRRGHRPGDLPGNYPAQGHWRQQPRRSAHSGEYAQGGMVPHANGPQTLVRLCQGPGAR